MQSARCGVCAEPAGRSFPEPGYFGGLSMDFREAGLARLRFRSDRDWRPCLAFRRFECSVSPDNPLKRSDSIVIAPMGLPEGCGYCGGSYDGTV